jgi:hypothetical protein
VLAHPLGVSRHGARRSARRLELTCPQGSRRDRGCLRRTVEPPLGLLDFPELEMGQGKAGRGRELEGPVTEQAGVPESLLSA